jgi:arsenate reductase
MAKQPYVVYYNPHCHKCQTAKLDFTNKGLNCNYINYLESPPTKEELIKILQLLNKKPLDIIRTKEEIFKKKFDGKKLSDDKWLDAIIKYPALLQRPIVIKGKKAWIARSEEVLNEIK